MTMPESTAMTLGVNIDHVATLRQARRTTYPDIIAAAAEAERGGADAITIHLREDRRHIQDADVYALKRALRVPMNLELALTPEMIAIAADACPAECCLVPEKRQELTTEGGLDVARQSARVRQACGRLAAAGTRVSLFIDPDPGQVEAGSRCGAPAVELHTGPYAEAAAGPGRESELARLRECAARARELGLQVNAGHGLTLDNVAAVAAIEELGALNIGHALVARAVFVGLREAVREMKEATARARGA